jgi:phage terminase large subunit-like protein
MVQIAETAKRYGVNKIVVESNMGDGMFTALLKPHLHKIYPCTVEEERATIQKEKRIIAALEPVMNQHRLVIHHDVVSGDRESTQHYPAEKASKYQLFYQMTRITKERGSLGQSPDRLDALAGAVAYWTEQMAVDRARKIAERKSEQMDALVRWVHQHEEIGFDGLALGRSLEDVVRGRLGYGGSVFD